MDAIDLLEEQHRGTEELFDRFEDSDDPDEQREIARRVTSDLRMHTTIEEEIFYPAVRERLGMDDDILEDLEEHHLVEMVLDELEGMDPSDERFSAKMQVLSELVEHHVDEEEEELFPEVREQMDAAEREELGERMRARAEELRTGGPGELTKEELYQRAQQLGVEGRSTMSKRQLADAVRREG